MFKMRTDFEYFLSLLGCHICEVYELGLSKNNFIVQKSQNTRTNFEIQFIVNLCSIYLLFLMIINSTIWFMRKIIEKRIEMFINFNGFDHFEILNPLMTVYFSYFMLFLIKKKNEKQFFLLLCFVK